MKPDDIYEEEEYLFLEGIGIDQPDGWVVEIEPGCWLAPWEGDPGRTLLLANVKRYKSAREANCALRRARTIRPLKYAKVYQLNARLDRSATAGGKDCHGE